MEVTLDKRRRLTIPNKLASMRPGDRFKVEFDADEDALIFRRIAKKADWLSVMKACPVPMDDFPRRRR